MKVCKTDLTKITKNLYLNTKEIIAIRVSSIDDCFKRIEIYLRNVKDPILLTVEKEKVSSIVRKLKC